MPFITFLREPKPYQITFEDWFNGVEIESIKDPRNTYTYWVNEVGEKIKSKTDFYGMFVAILKFNEKYQNLISVQDKSSLYRSFRIPKRSGGLRQIDAPLPPLMEALRELKKILECQFHFTYHTSAFAYVRGRSTKSAVERHKANKSRWFLKTDLHSFFNSSSPDFVMKMLYMTYPLSDYIKMGLPYQQEFEKAMSLCFLNGGLPQGTPVSPMLTNQMMIPFDHDLANICKAYRPHLCVTRYADDIHISSEYSFDWRDVQNKVLWLLKFYDAPFELNVAKTHYGSNAGRNWMLGLMYNKDKQITVGAEKKRVAKAMTFQFMTDFTNGRMWALEDTQHYAGLLSYYKMIEPKFVEELMRKYSEKFGVSVEESVKKAIKEGVAVS